MKEGQRMKTNKWLSESGEEVTRIVKVKRIMPDQELVEVEYGHTVMRIAQKDLYPVNKDQKDMGL